MSNDDLQSSSQPSASWLNFLRGGAVPIAVTLLASFAYQWVYRAAPLHNDSAHYHAVAEGRIAEIHDPFTKRVLYPWLVRQTAQLTGLSIEASFTVWGNLAFVVFAVVLLSLIQRYVRSSWFTLAFFLTPVNLILARENQLPDLLHASLLALFFLVLYERRLVVSLVLLALLQLTRESTLLVTFFFVIFTFVRRRWVVAMLAIAISVAGLGVAGKVAKQGLPNVHGVNNVVYLAAKVPYNLSKNVFGVYFWTDTSARNKPESFPDEPIFRMNSPSWLPTGKIKEFGLYKIDLTKPLVTIAQMLTLFGVLPVLVMPFLFRRSTWAPPAETRQYVLPIAFGYGAMSYWLAPCLGASTDRLISYGWPCFWIAAPMLISDKIGVGSDSWGRIALLHAIASWCPLLISSAGLGGVWHSLAVLAVAIPCHFLAYRHTYRTAKSNDCTESEQDS